MSASRQAWARVVDSLREWIEMLPDSHREPPHCACCDTARMLHGPRDESSDTEDDSESVSEDSDELEPGGGGLCATCQRQGCSVDVRAAPEPDPDLGIWW